jgi:hypothetical protein
MWNPFAKKPATVARQDPSGVVPDRVNELANQLQREGRSDQLETKLNELDRDTLSAAELESWWHLYGIAAFQAGSEAEALARFKEGHRLFPRSGSIAFSLGQQHIRNGEVDHGFQLFALSNFPHVSREFALAQARYAYLWNRYDEGRTYLGPFFDAYKRLRILDDHFLYVRGLPFFGRSWRYLAAFSILSGDTIELSAMTDWVSKHCHDHDFEALRLEQVAYLDDRPDVEIPALEARLAATPNHGLPSGYTRLKLAIARARASLREPEASRLVRSEALSANDFAWLEDIRTLALAEIAHRFGCETEERSLIDAFLVKQPLLFEPDIALNFHLLRYQERLKPRVTHNQAMP